MLGVMKLSYEDVCVVDEDLRVVVVDEIHVYTVLPHQREGFTILQTTQQSKNGPQQMSQVNVLLFLLLYQIKIYAQNNLHENLYRGKKILKFSLVPRAR